MKLSIVFGLVAALWVGAGAVWVSTRQAGSGLDALSGGEPGRADRVVLTKREWRARLSPLRYWVTREGGTEDPFSGRYARHGEAGTYRCGCCDLPLFASSSKFHSGTGWPSFTAPVAPGRVTEPEEASAAGSRVEVRCARCGAHLGHRFPDGPPPSGFRYCVNSAALEFGAE
jgi:peptide-methionine (R)-S-oxide reductase